MTIDIRFTFRPIGSLWCQVGLIFICRELMETGQEPSGLDQKTSSYLQYLVRQGFWRCEEGEDLLLAGEERIRAQKLLLKGLGSCRELSPSQLAKQVRASERALAHIGANDIGVRMPPLWGREGYGEILAETCITFSNEWSAIEGRATTIGPGLRLVYALDTTFLEDAEEAATRLRRIFSKDQNLASSLVVERGQSPGNLSM